MNPTNTDILANLALSLLNCGYHEEALRSVISDDDDDDDDFRCAERVLCEVRHEAPDRRL